MVLVDSNISDFNLNNPYPEEGFTAILNEQGIIEIFFNPAGKVVLKEHLIKLTETIREIGLDEKMLIYIYGANGLTNDPEGRAYSASEASSKYTKACAILIDNFLKKTTLNFFIKINKPNLPTKGFSTKEEAISWLLTL